MPRGHQEKKMTRPRTQKMIPAKRRNIRLKPVIKQPKSSKCFYLGILCLLGQAVCIVFVIGIAYAVHQATTPPRLDSNAQNLLTVEAQQKARENKKKLAEQKKAEFKQQLLLRKNEHKKGIETPTAAMNDDRPILKEHGQVPQRFARARGKDKYKRGKEFATNQWLWGTEPAVVIDQVKQRRKKKAKQ